MTGCSNSEVTFTFEPNNGSSTFELQSNRMDTLPIPEKENSKFIGWYIDSDLMSEFNYQSFLSGRSIQSEIQLFAKWTNEFLITVHGNNELEPSQISIKYLDAVNIPLPVNYGYELEGWFIDEDLTIPLSYRVMPSEDFSVFAKWGIGNYSLTYLTFDFNVQSTRKYTFDDPISLITPQREGFTFLHWKIPGTSIKFDDDKMPGYDVNLEPVWDAHRYTIRFNQAGISPMNVRFDDTVNLPTPVRQFYSFAGWELNGQILPQSYKHNVSRLPRSLLANGTEISLVAKWENIEYSRLLFLEDPDLGLLRTQFSYFVLDNRLLLYGNSKDRRNYHESFSNYLGYLDVTSSLVLASGEIVTNVYSNGQYTVVRTSTGSIFIDAINTAECRSNIGRRANFTRTGYQFDNNLQIAFTHFGVFIFSNNSLYQLYFDCETDEFLSRPGPMFLGTTISKIAGDYNLLLETSNSYVYSIDENFIVKRITTSFGDQTEDLFSLKQTARSVALLSTKTGFYYQYNIVDEDNLIPINLSNEISDIAKQSQWYSANDLGVRVNRRSKDVLFSDNRSLYLINLGISSNSTQKIIDFPSPIQNIINIQRILIYDKTTNNMVNYYLIITQQENYYVMREGFFQELTPPYRGIVKIFPDGVIVTRQGLNVVGDLDLWAGSINYGSVKITPVNQIYTDWRPFLGPNSELKESDQSVFNVPTIVGINGRTFLVNSIYLDPLASQKYYDNADKIRLMNLIPEDIPLFGR